MTWNNPYALVDTYEVTYKRDGQNSPSTLHQECEKDDLDQYGRPTIPQTENTILLDALQEKVWNDCMKNGLYNLY